MNKRKSIIIPVFTILITLIALAVFMYPYLPLKEGTFLAAALSGMYDFAIHYLGFFSSTALRPFTLIPIVLLLLIFTANSLTGVSFVFWLYEAGVFVGLYIFAASLQGYGPMFASVSWLKLPYLGLVGFGLFALCLILMILLKLAEKRLKKAAVVRRNRKSLPAPEFTIVKTDFDEEEPEKEYNYEHPDMTTEEAIASLENVVVPVFEGFPNFQQDAVANTIGDAYKKAMEADDGSGLSTNIFQIANMEGKLKREALLKNSQEKKKNEKDQETLRNIFKPRSLRKKLNQEKAEPEFVDFGSLDEDLVDNIDSFVSEEDKEPEQKVEEVVKQPVPEHEPEHLIDEGSDGEDEIEEATEKYKQMQNDGHESALKNETVDYVSSVGGLKSSRDGSYVFNTAKFTWKFPPESLLRHYETSAKKISDISTDPDGLTIVDTFSQFRIGAELVGIQHGPTFTLYELTLAKGIKVNSILNLAENIAMDLAVPSVRILAPIPGKSAIGIEVPNKVRDTIGFDIMMPALKAKSLKVPMVLGKTITGDSIVIDLAGTPHLLIAGTTGSGKSVCVNSLICSILYTKSPKEVRMILVDPKMVELTVYNDIPHLLTPVITDAKKAIKAMAFIVQEMERRMSMFSRIGARKIEDYNEKIKGKAILAAPLPYIVVVVDEFADLMTVVGKELESYIKRITAMARFTGIHLVLATQRPSADVITGIIKSNIPTQIAFAVSNQINSRIIIDNNGAEKLLGKGDMLYNSASNRVPTRIQGAYIDPEIEDIVNFVKSQGQPDYIDESYFEDDEDEDQYEDTPSQQSASGSEDLYMRAWRIVAERGEASASYLQRKLSIGYNRAANLIEQLEESGCIGPARGSKPREILRYPDSRSEGMQD